MELKNYIDFSPAALFSSPVKRTCSLLIFAFAVTYFLSITPVIQKNGFLIPDSLIDASMKFMPIPDSTKTDPEFNISNQQIPQEQLDMLKQNPALLKQYNIDPKMLDNIGSTKSSGKKSQTVSDLTQGFVKKTLQDQFNNMLKPYLSFIPIVLSVALFLTLQSLVSFLSMLIPPLFWFIFLVLGKTGFVNFTEEMRPVKKMVI